MNTQYNAMNDLVDTRIKDKLSTLTCETCDTCGQVIKSKQLVTTKAEIHNPGHKNVNEPKKRWVNSQQDEFDEILPEPERINHGSPTNSVGSELPERPLRSRKNEVKRRREEMSKVGFSKSNLASNFFDMNKIYGDDNNSTIKNPQFHTVTSDTNDIEIQIKIGDNLTNFLIKKKATVQLKVYSECKLQTSSTNTSFVYKNNNEPEDIADSANIQENLEFLHDMDIPENDSIKEGNVHLLKSSQKSLSEVTKSTPNSNEKRKLMELSDKDLSTNKRRKTTREEASKQSHQYPQIIVIDETGQRQNNMDCESVTPLKANISSIITPNTITLPGKTRSVLKNRNNYPKCPNFDVTATIQEEGYMSEASERAFSPALIDIGEKVPRFCIASSRLTTSQQEKLKGLCSTRNWKFVKKYTKDLTHLVVGVDDENKSLGSVKYMYALASGKWIISYKWVEQCLLQEGVVDEEPFEVLDRSGAPGPCRSRRSDIKLFQGMTFYCMPPFTELATGTIQEVLKMAGGAIASSIKNIKIEKNSQMAFLLADTQGYGCKHYGHLATEHKVVPLDYEWALNCLGQYRILPAEEFLLCPKIFIPKEAWLWPPILKV